MENPSPYAIEPDTPAAAPTGRGARPTGVAVLGVLAFVGAGLLVLGGLMTFAMGGIIGSVMGSEGAAFGATIGGFVAVFFLIGAAISALMGYGHWTGASWAWLLQIVLSGLSALSGLWSVAQGEFSAILGLAIAGLIIWYMLQPGVQRWYGRA